MQAHTLGEVCILGTVLLRVSSGTILTFFIEIGSYLTDREQKICWHSFFETRCIVTFVVSPTAKLYLLQKGAIFMACVFHSTA